IFLFIYGCDLFGTRSAEEPDLPRSNFEPAVTTDILIQNLINSFSDKSVENYLACFSDSSFTDKTFLFSPSGGAVSQFPSLSDNWGRKNEEQYFNNLKTKVTENSSMVLELFNVKTSPQFDSLIYTASYSLTVPLTDESIPEHYEGDLKFSMIRDARSVWVIYFWQDTKSSDTPSWSELKGRFY
ncbi:MAG: hypothetical protein ABI550_08045, partial [Ignavibacteriaceae bacterium]